MDYNLMDALELLEREKGVPRDTILEALANALVSAYKRTPGAAEEELSVAYGDERLEIGFNAKYLLEIASQVDRENAVFMFNSSGDPTLMREGNDTSAIYVVMPMRV